MGTNSSSGDEYTFRYSPEEPSEPAVTICRAVAWMHGTSNTELEPLARVIDTDALNGLFGATDWSGEVSRSSSGRESGGPKVIFEYEGHVVTVMPARVAID